MKFHIINGPNLNLLGVRQPGIYGKRNFESYFTELERRFSEHKLLYFQSNSEGALIDRLHEVGFSCDGIVLNAGGFSHTSVALADAVAALSSPVIEVHISNIFARESFRHHSYLSAVCAGSIVGLGLKGYELAISAMSGE